MIELALGRTAKAVIIAAVILLVLFGLYVFYAFTSGFIVDGPRPRAERFTERVAIQQVTVETAPEACLSVTVVGQKAAEGRDSIKITYAIIRNATGQVSQSISMSSNPIYILPNGVETVIQVPLNGTLSSGEHYSVTLGAEYDFFVSPYFVAP